MKKILLLWLVLMNMSWAAPRVVNLHGLPEHMRSYKNYIVVLVHGMGSSAEVWSDLRSRLSELVGDPEFAGHIYAYTMDEPYGAYYGNAAELGDRVYSDNWLDKARREFIAKHSAWPADKIPAKFILLTHSMGALAARSYIYSDALAASGVNPENFPRGFYQNDVKKALFIAPAHKGSSMADFVFHYMASDEGYKFGASGLLKQLLDLSGGRLENFAAYMRNRNSLLNPRENLPVVNEIPFTEETLKKYLTDLVRADFAKTMEERKTIRAQAREKLDKELRQALKDRLFEYANVHAAPGQNAPLFSGKWLEEQLAAGLVFALEQLAETVFTAYAAIRDQADSLEDFTAYLRVLDLQKIWNKESGRINTQMQAEGLAFYYQIKVDKNWPSGHVPSIKLTYRNWDSISLDWDSMLREFQNVLAEYRFSIKLTKDIDYATSLEDLNKKAQLLAELYTPLPRLFQVIAELDTAPLFYFPSAKVLLEVNNYCAADTMKELLDLILVNFFQKKALEDGALVSLLSNDPVTAVLNSADLPEIYDPVEYRNIIGRGSVAFDRRNTEKFNQFFYGDLPAMQGLLKDTQYLVFFSTLAANAYQIKLLSSAEYQNLPSGEARLGALALSYARGLFTKEGDGAVDIDSLSGQNIPSLRGAPNYYHDFTTPALSNYIDRGFAEDIVRSEAACALVEMSFNLLGGTTPPYVRGAIRLTPLFNFIAQMVNYKEDLIRDFGAHNSIMQAEYSLPHIQQALYDIPLLVLNNVYLVSGNTQIPLAPEALQEKTAAGQEETTVPLRKADNLFYLPLAYNVKAPKIRLDAELYDLAPHLAQVEYSFNFSPFVTVPADKWGAVSLPEFSVAEGQNIIMFRLTNKAGRKNEQYIRIIRSSTPLLASELFPVPQSAVAAESVTLSAIFYNAQFISNNIEVSNIEAVVIDDAKLPRGKYQLARGSNHAYRNFLKLEAPLRLAEGRHTVTLRARDSYSHYNETHWFFDVDLTPPEIIIQNIKPVPSGQLLEINYELANEQALQDLQIVLRKEDHVFWRQNYSLSGAGSHRENIANLNLTDGKYIVEIGAADMAGNRTIVSSAALIDSAPPEAELSFVKYVVQKNPQVVFTLTASEKITGQIILTGKDLRIPLELEPASGDYSVVLSAQNIPDGIYKVSAQLQDLAGNQMSAAFGELFVDKQGPQISGLHAEPAVLNKNNIEPYHTQIIASIKDDSPEDKNYPRRIKAQAVFIHKATGREIYRAEMSERSSVFSADFIAVEARYLSGTYTVKVTAEDAYGNKTVRECEVIKDGIVPEISAPADGAAIGGLALITGKVSDADWTNSQQFGSYAVYWAEGLRDLPADLRELDDQVWRADGIETPYLNRNGAGQKNISYRQAPENSLLCWWDTTALMPGAYTILLVSAEKNLGASSGMVRHVFVEPAMENKLSVRILKNFPASVDYAVEAGISFNILNNGSTANISAEIIDKYGSIVKHQFWPQISGVIYTGRPAEFSNGAYLWYEDSWHLLLVSTENCTFNILAGGIAGVFAADMPCSLNSGILQLSGYLAAGEIKEIVFDLPENIGNFYISAEKSTEEIWLRVGAGTYVPQTNSYVQFLANGSGLLSFGWDGRLQSGAYAENGVYMLRLLGSGLDGGICRESITFNITTPFTARNIGRTPEDGQFEALGDLHKITLAYAADKDSYLSAEIIDDLGVTVSVLPERKILGSEKPAYLSWNGAFPYFDSKQKLLSGNYRALLYFRTTDGQNAALNYENIKIQNNSSGNLARLDKLGETVLFNGSPVQAVSGSANYYWSARGEGAYTVPKSFSYELGASGEQVVTAASFVPFAGLYHRGFNKVQVKVKIEYEWDIDFSGRTRIFSYMDNFVFAFTPGKQEMTCVGAQNGGNHSGGFQGHGTRGLKITVTDMAGTVMYYSGRIDLMNKPGYSGSMCNGAFQINIGTGLWRSNDGSYSYHQATVKIKLMDDVKYSRLSNRYYAWFGYVNKYYPLEFQFDEMWGDLGKLNFIPSSYFRNGLNSITLNALIDEPYPKVLNTNSAAQNGNIIESLQKLNVLYGSMPYQDDSYYNYLADEYCEFIPMTAGQIYFVTENKTASPNLITAARVYSDQTITTNIPWPATEEYIAAEERKAVRLIDELTAKQEIDIVNYAGLPLIFDKQSVDFGGLGSSRLLVPAALGKKGQYQKKLAELAADLPKAVARNSALEFYFLKTPSDVEISFDNGQRRMNYVPSASVIARYTEGMTSDIFNWSTDQDFFLKNGVIDSPPLIFNEYGYALASGRLPIYEAYFATLNRRADLPSQNVTPIDYYTFLERDYYDPNSGYALNPNLDFECWTIQIYDQTGQPNQDLSVTDLRLSNTDILQNDFQVKLNLDAVENRYTEISGAAADAYELLYFDGENWQAICTGDATDGHLGWWDITQLNGSYTVVLKVYGEAGEYSLAKQNVYVGQLLRSGEEAGEQIGSPYKRAEVHFPPQAFAEDKFITVSPVKLRDLRLQNQPELYALGPIAEILPHGSEFPEADKRPTVVFHYSHDDLAELRRRGVDTDKMSLYYINESGALEQANSERLDTEYGLEIWTVLSHFSPYTMLSGEVPELPTFNAVLDGLSNRNLKVFGKARPNSLLEIYLDDDAYLGDTDVENIIFNVTATTDVSAWVFNRREWNEDFVAKLAPEQQNKILAGRRLLREMYLATLVDNHFAEEEYARQYALLITDDQERAEAIRDFLLANDRPSSGIQMQDAVDLQLGLTAPTLNNFLPERLEIILRESFPLVIGQTARRFTATSDTAGYFSAVLPLKASSASIFVTYVLTGDIQNRPVARGYFAEDLEAPRFLQIERSASYANKQDPAVTVNIILSKEAKLLAYCYDSAGELLDIQYRNEILPRHELVLAPSAEGEYYFVLQAVDMAGNQSQSYGLTLMADFSSLSLSDFILPRYIDPRKDELGEKITALENTITFSVQISSWEFSSGNYVEKIYPYTLTATDEAGNTVSFDCAVTVDITPPVLANLDIGPQAAHAVRLFWNEQEDCFYSLSARRLDLENINRYNAAVNYYYDELVSRDNFYEYTVQAIDEAGNESGILRRLVYTADDSLQTYLTDSNELKYQDFQARLEQNYNEDALFVIHCLAGTVEQPARPGTVQLTPVYRFLSSAADKTVSAEITMAFDPRLLAEKYIRPDTITALRYDKGWESLEILTVNYQDNTVSFRAASFGDYALFGGQEYWVYSDSPAALRFTELRDGDFWDIAATINATVRDPAVAINTQNIWLMLDNVHYALPPESFAADPASFGRAGRISFNLQKLLKTGLADGTHLLSLYVPNEAGHTANATLKFTTIENFEIDNVLPAPNPFGAEGMYFTYQLSKPADSIEIKIYDVNGRLVRTLNNCSNQTGYNKTKWDGRSERSAFVANDVYFYALIVEAEGRKRTIKGKIAALR